MHNFLQQHFLYIYVVEVCLIWHTEEFGGRLKGNRKQGLMLDSDQME